MDKSSVITWIFASFVIATPDMFEVQSPMALSASITTGALTELATPENKADNEFKMRRKARVKSRRIEHNDAELAQILNETAEALSASIHTEDVDLRSLLHATSGHTIKPMEKWLQEA